LARGLEFERADKYVKTKRDRGAMNIENFNSAAAPSFLSLIVWHEKLNDLFLSHQEALLELDIEKAERRLMAFKQELLAHMEMEEQILLPIYQRAGRVTGGPSEFFTGEHARMREFIERFEQMLAQLSICAENIKREIIKLFDEEARFKQLVEHHDAREETILYPTLDKITGEQERIALLKKLSGA
jgi:hemerythrin-like domain-containing protein